MLPPSAARGRAAAPPLVYPRGEAAQSGAARQREDAGVSREHVLGYLLWCAVAVPAVWLLFAIVLVPLMSLAGDHTLYLGLPAYVVPVPLTAFFIPALGAGPSGSS